jgi:hypothetical protein
MLYCLALDSGRQWLDVEQASQHRVTKTAPRLILEDYLHIWRPKVVAILSLYTSTTQQLRLSSAWTL